MRSSSSLWKLVLSASAAALLAGCPAPTRPELPVPECTLDSECADAKVCRAARCVDQCAQDKDCSGGRTCQSNKCVLPAGVCESDVECQAGEACAPNRTCQKRCQASGECGAGYACLGGLCLTAGAECTRNADCGPEEGCSASGECMPSCATAAECTSSETCSAGLCVRAPAECRTSADCTAPSVCGPAGRCGAVCVVDRECGAGQRCQASVCTLLAPACVRNSECPAAQACVGGTCQDACVQAKDCAVGETCSAGSCAKTPTQCTTSAQCTGNQVCGPLGACSNQCAVNADCGPSERCASGTCELLPPVCVRSSDCPADKACVGGTCQDQCVTNQDCAAGNQCQAGVCTLPSPQCLDSSTCDGGACSPAGQCVQACPSGSGCGGGSLCSNGACVTSGPTTGTLLGRVQLDGVADQSGVQVTARGPGFARALTHFDGGYAFFGLPPGRYGLTFEAQSSIEGKKELEVFASAGSTQDVPPVTFSPAGELRGTVTLQGAASHTGIRVFLSGTALGSVTDTAGAFSIPNVPVGSYQVVATYPGYDSAALNGVAVTYKNATVIPTQSLPQTPVSNQGGFGFTSIAPTSGRIGQPYAYTLRAAGGGVVSVVYGKSAGPAGLGVDPNTGVVSYTPSPADVGETTVAFSATGGGQTVYQVFSLSVTGAYSTLIADHAYAVEHANGVTWAVTNEGLHALREDGGRTLVPYYQDYVFRPLSQLGVVNGGRVLSIEYPHGTVGSVEAPVGRFTMEWQGGQAGVIEPQGGLPVTSVAREGGHVDAVEVQGTRFKIVSASVPRGVATSFSHGLRRASSVFADTGLVDAVAGTTITDDDALWPDGGFANRCLINLSNGGTQVVVANTANTITVASGDLSALFSPGSRYFVSSGNCSNKNVDFRIVDDAGTFGAPGALVNQRLDVYPAAGAPFSTMPVTANTADTVTVRQPVGNWPTLAALTGPNRFAVGPLGGHPVRVQFSGMGPLQDGGAVGSFVVLGDNLSGPHPILDNGPNDLTFTAPLGRLTTFVPNMAVRLSDSTGLTPATFTLDDGGLTPSAHVGETLYVESRARGLSVVDNTSDTLVATVAESDLPISAWTGDDLWLHAGPDEAPDLLLIDADGGIPGNLAGTNLAKLYVVNPLTYGQIAGSTATSVTLRNPSLSIADTTSALLGSDWAALGVASRIRYRVGLTANLETGAYVGSQALVVGAPLDAGSVVANTPQSVTVELSMVTANLPTIRTFDELQPGAKLALAAPGVAQSYRFRVPDTLSTHTPGQWRDQYLVLPSTGQSFLILDNDATGFELSVPANAVLANSVGRITPGLPFTFAPPQASGASGCAGLVGPVPVKGRLAGATLVPGAYASFSTVNSGFTPIPVRDNDATSFDLAVCPANLATVNGAWGLVGGLYNAQGQLPMTVYLPDAGLTPGGAVGLTAVRLPATGAELTFPVQSNGADRFTIALNRGQSSLNTAALQFSPGEKVTFVNPGTNEVPFSLHTDLSLPPGALDERFIRLHGEDQSPVSMLVRGTDGGQLFGAAHYSSFSLFDSWGLFSRDHVTISSGMRLSFRDAAGGWGNGAYVGEAFDIDGYANTIVSHTPTDFVTASADEFAYEGAREYGYLYFEGLNFGETMAALPGGDVLVAKDTGAETVGGYQFSPDGTLRGRLNPLTTGRKLTVRPEPLGPRTVAQTFSDVGDELTFGNPGWNHPPGALVGQYVRVFRGSIWGLMPIIRNTANTITALDNDGTSTISYLGKELLVDPYGVEVVGTTLVPDELSGHSLWLNGRAYLIRSNSASRIQLILPPSMEDDEAPMLADPRGQEAWVLSGITTSLRHVSANASGIAAGGSGVLYRFDGGTWETLDFKNSGNLARTVTVEGLRPQGSPPAILMPSENFVVDEWNGYSLVTSAGVFDILDTETDSLELSTGVRNRLGNGPPLLGEVVQLRADSLNGATVWWTSTAGNTTWAGTEDGLFRHVAGAGWTRMTVANTESSPGARDGLLDEAVFVAEAASQNEVWVAFDQMGLQRLMNGTWTSFTAQGTESAFGRRDGLPSDDVTEIAIGSSGVWVATSAGLGRFFADDWQAYGPAQGISQANDVAVAQNGDALVCTPLGLVRVTP